MAAGENGKIAFLILAHTDPEHVRRLIRALDHESDFYIHLDAKSNWGDFERLNRAGNVTFIEERVRVSWGGISMIDATLNLMRTVLKSGMPYSHLVLLSGSDYPIKSRACIHRYFSSRPGREFINFVDMRDGEERYMKKIERKWFKEEWVTGLGRPAKRIDRILRGMGDRLMLRNRWAKDVIPYSGSQWWALTPACCAYILRYVGDNEAYYEMNKRTFAPDEHFFHTIVGNSPFRDRAGGVQPFLGHGTWMMANFHMIHPSLTKWYTMDDWDEIVASDKLFVRKVGSARSADLIRHLDRVYGFDGRPGVGEGPVDEPSGSRVRARPVRA